MQRQGSTASYTTQGGIRVEREIAQRDHDPADRSLAEMLDRRRGVWFSSSFEFPGRYTRWDMGFADPPLVLSARGRTVAVEALNGRGEVLLPAVAAASSGRSTRSRLARRMRPASKPRSARRRPAVPRSSAAASPRSFRCCAR